MVEYPNFSDALYGYDVQEIEKFNAWLARDNHQREIFDYIPNFNFLWGVLKDFTLDELNGTYGVSIGLTDEFETWRKDGNIVPYEEVCRRNDEYFDCDWDVLWVVNARLWHTLTKSKQVEACYKYYDYTEKGLVISWLTYYFNFFGKHLSVNELIEQIEYELPLWKKVNAYNRKCGGEKKVVADEKMTEYAVIGIKAKIAEVFKEYNVNQIEIGDVDDTINLSWVECDGVKLKFVEEDSPLDVESLSYDDLVEFCEKVKKNASTSVEYLRRECIRLMGEVTTDGILTLPKGAISVIVDNSQVNGRNSLTDLIRVDYDEEGDCFYFTAEEGGEEIHDCYVEWDRLDWLHLYNYLTELASVNTLCDKIISRKGDYLVGEKEGKQGVLKHEEEGWSVYIPFNFPRITLEDGSIKIHHS